MAPAEEKNGEDRTKIRESSTATFYSGSDALDSANEARIGAAIDLAADAVACLDGAGRLQLVNVAFRRLFGYSRDDAVGLTLPSILARPRDVEATQELPAGGRREIVARDREGREFPAEILVSAPLIPGSARTIIIRDLQAERRAAEAERDLRMRARQQEAVAALGVDALSARSFDELMEQAVNLLADALEVDCTQVLQLLPDRGELLLRAGVGWPEGSVGSATLPAGRGSQAGYAMLSRGPVVVPDLQSETRFVTAPLLHERGVVSGMSTVIHGEQGLWGVVGAQSLTHRIFSPDDVNFLQSVANVLGAALERALAEEARRESQARLAEIFEIAADAIITLDDEQRITSFNKGAERIFGYTSAEVLHRPLDVLLPARLVSVHRTHIQRFATAPETARFMGERQEILGRHKTGREFPAEASISKLQRGGRASFTVILRDVTQRRETEELVRRLDRERLRRRQALELNDNVVQGLVLAEAALTLGRTEDGARIIAQTLAAAHRLVRELLGEALIQPGDLVREEPARLSDASGHS